MSKETILITGSEGSLMQAVLPKLTNKYNVVGVDMKLGSMKNNDDKMKYLSGIGDGYLFKKGDLANEDFVAEIIAETRPRYIIQAAARIYGVGGFNANCADILGDDITLHRNVLKYAKEFGTERVVYISSSMVYEGLGDNDGWPVREEQVVNDGKHFVPKTDYGLSKLVGERLSRAYFMQYGLNFTIWRPFNIITPFEYASKEEVGISHVFADFIRMIVENEMNPMPILGDGNQIRCFTWIDDVAQAIADHSFLDTTENSMYNLGRREPVTMRELATKIHNRYQRKMGLKKTTLDFLPGTGYDNDVLVRVPNVDLAEHLLGWRASVSVDEAINRCVDHYIMKTIKW